MVERAGAEEEVGWGSPVPAEYGSLRAVRPQREKPTARPAAPAPEPGRGRDRWAVSSLLRRLQGDGSPRPARPARARRAPRAPSPARRAPAAGAAPASALDFNGPGPAPAGPGPASAPDFDGPGSTHAGPAPGSALDFDGPGPAPAGPAPGSALDFDGPGPAPAGPAPGSTHPGPAPGSALDFTAAGPAPVTDTGPGARTAPGPTVPTESARTGSPTPAPSAPASPLADTATVPVVPPGFGLPPADIAVAGVAGRRSRRDRRPARVRSRATIRHLDILTVIRVSVIFWLVVLVAFIVASVLLWTAADAFGSLPSIEKSVRTLFSLKSFTLHPGPVAAYTAAGGSVIAVAGTLATIVCAVIYNLIADVVGGVRVELESFNRD